MRYYDVRRACKDDVYKLLGKGYHQEWTNLAGMNQVVNGKVVSCSMRVDGGSLQ